MKTIESVDGMPIKTGLDDATKRERDRCLKILKPYLYVSNLHIRRTITSIVAAVEGGIEL